MESEDDPDLKRIQKILEEQGDPLSGEERTDVFGKTAKPATPASAYGDGRSFAERAREACKRIGAVTAQTRRDQVPASVEPSAAPPKAGTRLKELKRETNLTWDTIAQEAGISRRWLLEISAVAIPHYRNGPDRPYPECMNAPETSTATDEATFTAEELAASKKLHPRRRCKSCRQSSS